MRQEKRKKRGGEILLSAHVRTSQADILHLDQNHSSSFKTRFSAKSPGANGLIIKKINVSLLKVQLNDVYNDKSFEKESIQK